MATKSAIPKKEPSSSSASKPDADDLGDTYVEQDETREQIVNDLDDFERRLNGEQPTTKKTTAPSSKARAIPKSNIPPMMVPVKHVAIKPTAVSEEEEDSLEAIKAVSELDLFEKRQGIGK
mmetsp:Transcript_51251/g.107038  ORF Transcript_51251/g.107038 Transcript_51251/m.107038 type:complete len:121 (-) Transcript_51251:381-743(-)